MDIRKLIKKDAWLAMRNNWGKAFAVVLISFSFLIFTVLIEKLLSYILDVSYFIDYAQTPAFYLDDITNLGPTLSSAGKADSYRRMYSKRRRIC